MPDGWCNMRCGRNFLRHIRGHSPNQLIFLCCINNHQSNRTTAPSAAVHRHHWFGMIPPPNGIAWSKSLSRLSRSSSYFTLALGATITLAVSWCKFHVSEGRRRRLPSVETSYPKKRVALGYDIDKYHTLLPRELIPIHRASRDTPWRRRLARHQPIWRKQLWGVQLHPDWFQSLSALISFSTKSAEPHIVALKSGVMPSCGQR